jgi:hypothetical protein
MANEHARRLRSNVTDAEKKLWWRLRVLKREGFHFRPQVPIDHLMDGVEDVIRDALTRGAPTPNPSPQGGGASEGRRLARNSTQ